MSAELEKIVSQLSDSALLEMVDSDPAALLIEAITAANATVEARGGKAALQARLVPTEVATAAIAPVSPEIPSAPEPAVTPPPPAPAVDEASAGATDTTPSVDMAPPPPPPPAAQSNPELAPVPVTPKAPAEPSLLAPAEVATPATPAPKDSSTTTSVAPATPEPSVEMDQAAIEAMLASAGAASAATETPEPAAASATPATPEPSADMDQAAIEAMLATASAGAIDTPKPSPVTPAPVEPVASDVDPLSTNATGAPTPVAPPVPSDDSDREEAAAHPRESPPAEPNRTAVAERRCQKRRGRLAAWSVTALVLLAAGGYVIRERWHPATPMATQARELSTAPFLAALGHCQSVYEESAGAARTQIAEAMTSARQNAQPSLNAQLALLRYEYRRRPSGLPKALEKVRTEFESLRQSRKLPAALETDFEKFGQIIAQHHRFLSRNEAEGLEQWFNDYVRLSAISARIHKASSRMDLASAEGTKDHDDEPARHQPVR